MPAFMASVFALAVWVTRLVAPAAAPALPAAGPPHAAAPAAITVSDLYQFTPPAGARVSPLPASPSARLVTLEDPPARVTLLTSPRQDDALTSPRAVQGLLDAFAAATQVRTADTRQVVAAQLRVLVRTDDLHAPGVGVPGSRAVIEYQAPSGRRVQAWTVFTPYTDLFLNIELDCPADSLERALPIYDALIESINFDTAAEAALARQRAVLAGDDFLRSLTAADLRTAADGVERWYRLWTPAEAAGAATGRGPRGATEVGYRSVRAWAGRASELSGPAAGSPQRAASPEGVLTRVVTRTLTPLPGSAAPRVTDTVSSAFVSLDRAQETWTVQTVVTDPGSRRPSAATVTGLRQGGTLQVSSAIPGQPARAFRVAAPDAAVLSQAELLLLPRVLQGRALLGSELGFYAYQIDAESFTLRRVVLGQPSPDGPSPAAGQGATLELATRTRDEPGWVVTPLGPDGWPTGADPSSALRATPTSRQQLLDLWKRLGLPTGSPAQPR